MSVITSLNVQEKNKNKCNLYLDGEFLAGISIEVVIKYGLRTGMEIERSKLQEVLDDSEKVMCLAKAISYLSRNIKTKKQVIVYLQGKGYSENTIKHCVSKLIEYKYIDDSEYAKRYIESVSKRQGKKLAAYNLMMKGVRKDVIDKVYDECNVCSRENAKNIAEKYLKNKDKTRENVAKAYRYLISKGFSYDEANYAVCEFKDDV